MLLDANLLIYAVNKDAPMNRRAKTWLEAAVSGSEAVGISWNVLLAFIRITTRSGLFRNPLSIKSAFDLIESWLSNPSVTIVHPGPRHLAILRDLLQRTGTGGNLSSDAHLAALAIENDAELCSSDTDFARFTSLKWTNPLA